jgi:eukaryotic-like serine/threonine-protein kinase
LLFGMGACLVLLAGIAFLSFLLKPSDRQTPQENTESGARRDVRPANEARADGDEAWLAEVAALPAKQQVESVAAKLKERNPGFDGRVLPTIEKGVVTELQFTTDKVTDISPVRALVRLRSLSCGGTRDQGKLEDLSPLKGLKLTTLACARTQVSDLSPLTGMKLKELNVWYTPVSDLSPLQGMPLRILGCGGTQVADLSPLTGMQLEELNVWGTPVSDLSPLKGMKLTTLACGSTMVSDLSPLQGMRLSTLHCDHTPVEDLSPLRNIELICLSCENTHVADLTPLKGMPLKKLWCDVKAKRDIEVVGSVKTLETINGKPPTQFWQETGERSLPQR